MSRQAKISVLLCTLNRPELIKNCIASFLDQTYERFEIIVVDQSRDKDTEESCRSFNDPRIKYYHVEFTGLSKARNYGLKYCNGEYICLGDDDAVYDKDFFISAVKILITKGSRAILCGKLRYLNPHGKDVYDYTDNYTGQRLSKNDMMRIGSSATLLLPRRALCKVHGFDEDFGVGAQYGSGEESDVIFKLMRIGYSAYYVSEMIIYHGDYENDLHPNITKVYEYYKGLGALLKKHIIYGHDITLISKFARATAGAYIKWMIGNKEQKRIYRQRISGFNKGFFEYKYSIGTYK